MRATPSGTMTVTKRGLCPSRPMTHGCLEKVHAMLCMSSNQKGARSSLMSAFMETNMVVGLNAKYALCVWVIGHALAHAAALPADQCQMQYGLPLSCCVRLGNGSAARQWTCEPRCWLWNAGGVRARALPPVLLVPLLAMAMQRPAARPVVEQELPGNRLCTPGSAQHPWQLMAAQLATSWFKCWSTLSDPGCLVRTLRWSALHIADHHSQCHPVK